MQVAERAVYDFRNFQPDDVLRGFEVTRTAELDPGVPALCEQERNPADLQLRARTDQQIGGADAGDEAGTRFDTVRILKRGGSRVHRHFVSPQFLGQGAPFGFTGEYIERR